MDLEWRVVKFYEKHNISKLGSIKDIIKNYSYNGELLCSELEKKYNDIGFFSNLLDKNISYKERLIDFYSIYAPEKIGLIDLFLEKYKNNEEQLISLVKSKYIPNESKVVDPELDFTSDLFNASKALHSSSVVFPVANIYPLDNISKCRSFVIGVYEI